MATIPGSSNREIRLIAQHECGHYVIARVLGYKTGAPRMEVFANGGHRGQAEIELHGDVKDFDSVERYTRGRAIVLATGALGEAIDHGQVKRADAVQIFKGVGAQQDYAKYREMVYLLRNMKHPMSHDEKVLNAHLEEIDRGIWDEAMKLVRDERDLIVELAKLLAAKCDTYDKVATLPEDEINALPSVKKRFKI